MRAAAQPGQLDLLAQPRGRAVRPRAAARAAREAASTEERFEAWLASDPHVYRAIKRLALAELRAGARRIGVKRLAEQLRADPAIRAASSSTQPFVIDNSFTALVARRLVEECPELEPVIEIRRRRGE